MVRKILVFVVFSVIMPAVCFPQVKELLNLIDKGEFAKVKEYTQRAYAQDTAASDRYNVLYNYYKNEDNPDADVLKALYYLKEYNKTADKKIEEESFARSVLTKVYLSKDIDKFNCYINLTEDNPKLSTEAKRIRDRLAYEKVKQSKDVNEYKRFVENYPDALQADEAKVWLNENIFQSLLENGNADSLRSFARATESKEYKQKAMEQLDRLAYGKASKKNTLESYSSYLKEFPEGMYAKVARENMDKVRYDKYIVNGKITDMLHYLNNHDSADTYYKEVVAKLSYLAYEHYSLTAMSYLMKIDYDAKLLERFAKRYISDLDRVSEENLLAEFPMLKESDYIIEAQKDIAVLESLKVKKKLSVDDYKKHKPLFKTLNARAAREVFFEFDYLNGQLPKNKALNFNLWNDVNYMKFFNAKNTEFDFILTEKGKDYKPLKRPDKDTGIENTGSDAVISITGDVILYSVADTDGYGWYEGSGNRDIYVSLYKDGVWTEPLLLPSVINTRFDECNPVLSADKKTLWFSSDRGLSFGKKDIYVSFRADTNDWMTWSEPVLLSEDFNTADDDYVVNVTDNMVVVTQDGDFKEENNIYLEGNTSFDVLSGRIIYKGAASKRKVKISISDKKTLSVINMTETDENGFYAFIKPDREYVLQCLSGKYFCPLADSVITAYDIQTVISKQELITINSPFDSKGNITLTGKKNLHMLADCLADIDCIVTIGVHATAQAEKQDSKSLSEKQAGQIFNMLVKYGMGKDNIIVAGYGKEKVVQGWENVDCVDIGIIRK